MHNFTQKVKGHFENDDYVFFWGGPFSNWYESKYELTVDEDTIEFNCSEQQYMAAKALCFNDAESYNKIMESDDPRVQKAIGQKVKNYDDSVWAAARYDAMLLSVYLKFSQNKDLQKILLDTGNKILCEASPFDIVWGIGMGADHPDILDQSKWKGQNLLGEALMEIRELIKGDVIAELES
jgi:ribA/ribD-fused uncharacterized protein